MSRRLIVCLVTIPLILCFCCVAFAQFEPDIPPIPEQPFGDDPGPPPPPPPPDIQADDGPSLPPQPAPGKTSTAPVKSDWRMYRFDPAHTGYTREQLRFPLKLAWKYVTDITSGNPSSPAVEGNTVYFCSASRLYAVDTVTGALKWRYPEDQQINSSIRTSPLVGEDLVYFGAGNGSLYAITKKDGVQAWRYDCKGSISSPPVLVDGTIYVGSTDNHLYSLDANTGRPRWPGGFRTKDDVNTSPAVSDGYVYFVANEMVLYAAHADTGKIKWVARVNAPTAASSPVVYDGIVYVASGRKLQAFHTQSGRVQWEFYVAADITTAPAVSNGVLYFASSDGKLYAVNTSGKQQWKAPVSIGATAYGSPIVAGDTIFLGANRGIVLALNKDTGEVKWRYITAPSLLDTGKLEYSNVCASPVVSNGNLYVLADDGTLFAFNNAAPDNTPPQVSGLMPGFDSLLPGAPPVTIGATVDDLGSGIKPDSLKMLLNGKEVAYEMQIEKGLIYYRTPVTQPVNPLADGRHTVTIKAVDWAGNVCETSWSFIVDNRITATPGRDGNYDTFPGMMPGAFPGR